MPVRVMHVVRPADGGMREHVKGLLGGLQNQIQPLLVCPAESALFAQVPPTVQKEALSIQDGVKPWLDIRSIFQLRNLMERHPVDILHTHGAKAALIGRAAVKLCRQKPRVICTYHNFVEPENRLVRGGFLKAERNLAPVTDRYIAVSNALADQLRQQIGMDPEQVVTVYNGLPPMQKPLSRKQSRILMHVPEEAYVIGTIARLIPEKGVSDLLHAFRKLLESGHSNVYLVIIGDGPQKHELQEAAGHLSGRIRWMGAVKEASRLIPGFDLYIQSSRKEGFGLAVLEAMRQGVPVIASNVGGMPEVIGTAETDGSVSGILIPSADPERLWRSVENLLRDREKALRIGMAGKRRVEERFSLQQMIDSTIGVYDQVLSLRRLSH